MDLSDQHSSEERLWAALAHGSALFLWVGIFGPTLIWAFQRGKSAYIRFHALQSLGFQIVYYILWRAINLLFPFIFFALLLLLAAISDLNSNFFQNYFNEFFPILIIGCIFGVIALYPIMGIVGGIMCITGRNFYYPFLGKWLEKYLRIPPTVEGNNHG